MKIEVNSPPVSLPPVDQGAKKVPTGSLAECSDFDRGPDHASNRHAIGTGVDHSGSEFPRGPSGQG